MPEMVEHTEAQDDIKLAKLGRVESLQVKAMELHLGVEEAMDRVEALRPVDIWRTPFIERNHLARTTLLSFECEEAVGAADIQDALTGEVLRQA
jgi:hypothetical protein